MEFAAFAIDWSNLSCNMTSGIIFVLQPCKANSQARRCSGTTGMRTTSTLFTLWSKPAERLLARSDAILFLLKHLGGIWKLATLGKVLPRPLRDWLYGLVARNRYRVFGKSESCMLPDPKQRAKFLDQ
jgi:predicted DCC family thiol-disulfide oxidoreductase YuxK